MASMRRDGWAWQNRLLQYMSEALPFTEHGRQQVSEIDRPAKAIADLEQRGIIRPGPISQRNAQADQQWLYIYPLPPGSIAAKRYKGKRQPGEPDLEHHFERVIDRMCIGLGHLERRAVLREFRGFIERRYGEP